MYSLRNLNGHLKLKSRYNNLKNIEDLVWVKRKNKKEYFTEASTLNKYHNIRPKNLCPVCDSVYSNDNKINEDSVSWIFKCKKCKYALEVYKN